MPDVADATRVTKPALYRHCGSEPALYGRGMASTTTSETRDPVHRVSMSFDRDDAGHLWVSAEIDDDGHLPEQAGSRS